MRLLQQNQAVLLILPTSAGMIPANGYRITRKAVSNGADAAGFGLPAFFATTGAITAPFTTNLR